MLDNNLKFQFNQFGKGEIEFAELAKIWEDNQFDVINEPAGLFWNLMVDYWPKSEVIHVVRDEISWKKSYRYIAVVVAVDVLQIFSDFLTAILGTSEIQQTLEVVLYRNPHISPTVNEAASCFDGYTRSLLSLTGMRPNHLHYIFQIIFVP